MILGFPNRTSRSKTVKRPADVDVTVWLTPSECLWDYMPEPPYRIVRASVGFPEGRHFYAWEEPLDEPEMFGSFATRHLPRPMQYCTVVDSNLQVALGWMFGPVGLEWAGCQRMFDLLAVAHNPVDAAMWEQSARTHLERRMTLEEMTWQ